MTETEAQSSSAPSSGMVTRCLSTIVSYPELLQHEESLSLKAAGSVGAYDVMAWVSYLESMDDVLDALKDGWSTISNKKHQAVIDATITTIEAGGSTFHISSFLAPGITHTPSQLRREMNQLVQARILVAERAVSLLPGSYKLWKNHLLFRMSLLDDRLTRKQQKQQSNGKDEQREHAQHRIPPYLLHSSSSHRLYRATLSAFERSLVRLHKMPRIWLLYAAFLSIYDPARSPTNMRRVYDRALLALPASQHERIWEDYLCFVTGILPTASNDITSGTNAGGAVAGPITRRGTHKVKYGVESPLVAEWRKRGWGYAQVQSSSVQGGFRPTVPTETALRILRRYALCFDTTFREDLAALCVTRYQRYGEAASLLLQLLNNEGLGGNNATFLSPNGTTRHELWLRFADVCTGHPNEAKVAGVDFDSIIRAVLKGQDVRAMGNKAFGQINNSLGEKKNGLGFEIFDKSSLAFGSEGTAASSEQQQEPSNESPKEANTDSRVSNHRLGEMEGTLWTRLAEYHFRAGDFELARSVYEEALDAITRVRDFSLVFDAYIRFEEGVIEALMELMEEDELEEEDEENTTNSSEKTSNKDDDDDDEDLDILLGDSVLPSNEESAGTSADVELAISRAEHLTLRRPLLLNRVLLRQNPHNIGEWIKRSKLYLDLKEVDLAASALEEGLKSVIARKAVNGSPPALVLSLVDIHENKRKDLEAARQVLEKICTKNEYEFQDAEDLAQCHAAWVELELRHECWDTALNLARRAVNVKKAATKAGRGLGKSLRLWNLLFDLEESLGTVQTTKDAYDRALESKVATPSHILNYASFLKDHKYFEESFAAYERGLELFPFPHDGAASLWKNYLTNFLERYDGSKMSRVRELFDRCLDDCPSEISPEFFLMYGEYEEKHGLTKRALSVYERMCYSVPSSEKYNAYRLYIAKAIQYLGVTSARPIYERAISALEDGSASRICLEYAKMETGLREIDRARTVLVYGAQLSDPRRDPGYWKAWQEFEVSHGNEETFREMLRVKRSVQAAFSTVNYNAAEMGAGAPKVETLTDESALEMIANREGVKVNDKPLIGGFVQGKRTAEMADLGEVERRAARLREATAAKSASAEDEIDIDDIEEEEQEEDVKPSSEGNYKNTHVKGVSEKAIPAAVFGGLAASGNA